CKMYIWDSMKLRWDGAMENDIVVDEMMHGVTNCMMGSGTGRCLQMTEAGGLGEGWSDTMAKWVVQNSAKVEDFVMGQYILGMAQGIRTYPYSTNAYVLFPISAPPTSLTGTICRTTNPLCYSNLTTLNEVHAIGEVWANMLHNVYTALVDAHGFLTTALMDLTGEQGNVVFMHLMISALLLQPCNPTFVSACDAWIQADLNQYQHDPINPETTLPAVSPTPQSQADKIQSLKA
ncbi:peptidase M36, partial [Tricholoma matsutake]